MTEGRDDELVTRAREGDPAAWRELHCLHAGRLEAWLRTRPTGDVSQSPEDVAAEAWLVASSKIADFAGTADEFGGWLFGIARKLGANARRTAQRRSTRPEDFTGGADAASGIAFDAVPDHGDAVDHQTWLRSALATLPPRERDAVALVDGLGMDRAEAATILGVSAVTLRVARHRGLKKLEKLMGTASP